MVDIKEGLTFDDVLLIPKKSSISSRKDVDISTRLSKKIKLNIPIISANMDTVTEANLAIALARLGGMGIIHRFLTIEQQVEEVEKVKRSESYLIENPYTLNPDKKLKNAKEIIGNNNHVTGLLVTNEENKLVGILTKRDTLFETDLNKKVSDLMTTKLITAPYGTTLEEAKEILRKNKIEKLPLVDKNNKLKGLITISDIVKMEKHPLAIKDGKGRLKVGAAIGVKDDFLERAESLINAGVDILVVDIAHGHSENAINTIKQVKKNFSDIEIIGGNVATAKGTEDLIKAGADVVKIGVGPGSVCTTRIITGSGVPQLTAILDCCKIANKYDIPIISDGGIRTSGDITKALVAGVSTVMIGNLFAGTEESPGYSIHKNGKKFKIYRGMAGFGASTGRKERENGEWDGDDVNDFVPEGIESLVPYRGYLREVVNQLIGGIRSGFSYCGANNLRDLRKNSEFIKITKAGMRESKTHNIDELK